MLVMVQREVAERLCAPAGSDAYGAVSVKVAYWATARIAGHGAGQRVPASTEGGVGAGRHSPPAGTGGRRARPEPLFQLVRTAFGQRRKMLRRSLADVVTPEVFETAGIDAQRRPEELDIAEWGALTTRVAGGNVSAIVVTAPAKLTLSLHITGVRADGYPSASTPRW